MLRRIDRRGERYVRVADYSSTALRASYVARRKTLAVLESGDFVVDRQVRKRARQKHELHRRRRPVGGNGPCSRGERLSEQLSAIDPAVLVDFGEKAAKVPWLRRGEGEKVRDLGAIPGRRLLIHAELPALAPCVGPQRLGRTIARGCAV